MPIKITARRGASRRPASRKDRFSQLASFLEKKQRAPLIKTLTIAKSAKQLADRDITEINLAIGSIRVSLPELQEKYRNFGQRLHKAKA